MKISHNWLSNYIQTDLAPEVISDILTQTGLEVEGLEKIETIPGGLKGLVVGHVISCSQHPNADKLKCTLVDVGQENPLPIVCGAPNVAEGQKVIVATVGTTLYPSEGEAFKIKKSKIRGEVSEGMICAEDEIGLGNGHEGIMVLGNEAQVGQAASDIFDIGEDLVFEIGLTPNRTDAMSHIGVARDLKAALNTQKENSEFELQLPEGTGIKLGNKSYKIEIENEEACPLYTGILLENCVVQDSPDWLKTHLNNIGIQPKNNIVDITNFVLHEWGQPLHAFDADEITGDVIRVKNYPEGTSFLTLDGVERKLDSNDLMIGNAEAPMCIAGVLGGEQSGVSEKTTRVFLESAYFHPVSVRKTAKRHAINSDASFRFERGIDPNRVVTALKRAAELLVKFAGAEIQSDILIAGKTEFPSPVITYDWKKGNQLMGLDLDKEQIKHILHELEICVTEDNGEKLTLHIPTYRVDVTRPVDVVEEILRIYGFNQVPIPTKLNASLSHTPPFSKEKIQNRISDLLASLGFAEAMNNSLTKGDWTNDAMGPIHPEYQIALSNPLSSELNTMRQSLIPGLLESVKRNLNFNRSSVKLFEFGATFNRFPEGISETPFFTFVVCGDAHAEIWNKTKQEKLGFYAAWTAANEIMDSLGLKSQLIQKPLKNELFAEGTDLFIRKTKIGSIGQVNSTLNKAVGIKSPVFAVELNWDLLLGFAQQVKTEYKPLPKFPSSRRDLSLLLNNQVSFGELHDRFKQADRKLLQKVSLFDVYEGDKLPEGKKSYALSFIFQDNEKTITDKQVDRVMDKITQMAQKDFEAEIR